MKKTRCLITGSLGFIGSHLGDYLVSKGYDVVGLDNFSHPCKYKDFEHRMFPTFYADVRYQEDLENYIKHSDIVYHLAAQINVDKSIEHPQETLDINLNGTKNVLDICRRYRRKLVFSSSSEVYGGQVDKISESSPTYAQSPYAVSKLAADKLCGNYHQLYGMNIYRARMFNTFGPRQSSDTYGAVIPIFIKRVLKDIPPLIFGDGSQRRDYIYVEDVVRAYEMIPNLKSLNGEPINIGTGHSHSILEIANMIIKNCGKDIKPILGDPRPGEVCKLEADITLAKKFGFSPKVNFEDGLRRIIEYEKK